MKPETPAVATAAVARRWSEASFLTSLIVRRLALRSKFTVLYTGVGGHAFGEQVLPLAGPVHPPWYLGGYDVALVSSERSRVRSRPRFDGERNAIAPARA